MFKELREKITNQEQMSEAFVLGIVLAFAGGFFDAYTYMTRGQVFANAQTGNLVLMFVHLMKGEFLLFLRYLFPVFAFALGIFLVYFIQHKLKTITLFHWREGIILAEILLVVAVGFIPQSHNMYANVLISFACAIQLQAFRRVCGNDYASTMCTGNLRSGMVALSKYITTKQRIEIEKVFYYFGIIFIFGIGAGLGGILSSRIGDNAVWITMPVFALAIFLMELDRKRNLNA